MTANRWFLLGVYLTLLVWSGYLLVLTEIHSRKNILRGETAVSTGRIR